MEAVLRLGLKAWRRIAGDQTYLERALRRQYRLLRSRVERKFIGPNFVTFWGKSKRSKRVGIFVRGSCDLASMFSCQPLIHRELDGTCCILFEGAVWDSTSTLLLQTLRDIPQDILAPVIENLKLPVSYFRPGQLFEKSMTVEGMAGSEDFPKNIVIMSVGPDVIRTLYRHKEHGFLIDPGGWWFNQGVTNVLSDLSMATWFRKHFERVGRITVDEFSQNLTSIVRLIKERTGAHVLVYNVLTIEPGSQVHNYHLINDPLVKRAREFDLRLFDLSRSLDIAILDVDRVLKRQGVRSQVDYAHFPPELYPAVAREAFRIMREFGVV